MGQNGELIGVVRGGCENVLKLNCGDGCTPGECAFKKGQNTEFLPFKLINCMIYEL